tara:strand:+ start:4068 stop:4664 length:597 start_codon:yes stop_codon:yes gene_type:complete
MDRLSRQIANSKQEKIQVVRSQPSAATLREGQEVMYLTRDNRLARYRKEQGRLWVSHMNANENQIVDNNLSVKRDLSVGKDLKVDGILDVNGSVDLDGNMDINGTLSASQIVQHTGNTGTKIQFDNNTITFYSGHSNPSGEAALHINSSGVVINNAEDADIDFTVKSVKIIFSALPTSDPGEAGELWNSSGTLKVSAG